MKRVIATLLLLTAPAQAQVSSTAAPVANSSGSVTNQAVQVVPSRQFTNTYGGGISCQGATLNINPFVSSTTSWADPYESHYQLVVELMKGLMFSVAPWQLIPPPYVLVNWRLGTT